VTTPLAVVIVIPARNEEELVAACLHSVEHAISVTRDRLGARCPTIEVIFVADHCTDSTAAVAGRFDVFVIDHHTGAPIGNVGAARALGVDTGLSRTPVAPDRVWLAHTDADSRVPENWILHQLELADADTDLMVGTVRPDFDDLPAGQIELWEATHTRGEPNGHVHGANLGIRADVYLAAGGFQPLAEHEDVGLVTRALALGARSTATDSCEVITSGRPIGRTPGGYAAYLRAQRTRIHEQSGSVA
jgi:glycosyltransferase involved in cell wall biosynthesis